MTNPSPQLSNQPIRLHFGDKTLVVVTPDDEDRFMTTAAQAARACQHVQDIFQWRQEFDRLLSRVNEWCKSRADSVAHAFMAFSQDGLKLVILTKGESYRFDLDDAISELDIELANTFERCPTDVIHFPEVPVESLTSFFDSGKALQLYGE